jgi:hypothetical protein
MDSHFEGLRHRLLLALGLVGGAVVGSSCLDTAPIEECFDIADDDPDDEVAIITLDVGPYSDCPSERAEAVKEAAQQFADDCTNRPGGKLRYIACGPLEDRSDNLGQCEYVAVFDRFVGNCDPEFGRPFLVDAKARTAGTRARADWTLACDVERPGDERLAQQLAAHWTEVALAEHASVAAFARFALQLMSIAAPAELLVECQAAMVDETRHARVAFALASRFAGVPVGPGPLDIEGALADTSIEAILRDVVLEGCLGETRAAAEARAAAAECEHAEIRVVLEQIAHDEERHAALAWRFVAWLLVEQPELTTTFERALSFALEGAFPIAEGHEGDRAGRAWGLLDATARRHIDVQTRASIVAPLGRALLARRAAGRVKQLGQTGVPA